MKEKINPFPVNGYFGPSFFCDREAEMEKILKNISNRVNTTLFSIRRMGKTGLLYHLFHTLRKRKVSCIYIDLYASLSLKDFTNQLGSSVMRTFPERNIIGKKLLLFIKSLRPVISYDSLTGEPQVSFEFNQPKQYEHSLESIFTFLEKQSTRIVIAFDEFQQIMQYPEKNTEALLRTMIQPLKNVSFIFCGSSRHMLAEIFNNSKRPFFASTQPLSLASIDKAVYKKFIAEKFKTNRKKISEEAIDFILDWSRTHTFYTQFLCNRVYGTDKREIGIDDVRMECDGLLREQESVFFQYRNLLTILQWKMLEAIAVEDKLYKPLAGNFLRKYEIGTASNVQRSMDALLQKEMIYRDEDENGSYIRVYDCFLARWFQRSK